MQPRESVLEWNTEIRDCAVFHIGTLDGTPCAQIRESSRGVSFRVVRNHKPLYHAPRFNAVNVERAKMRCDALVRRNSPQIHRNEIEIMRRKRYA